MKDGKSAYTYNFLGLDRYTVTAVEAVPAGEVTLKLDFAYDGDGLGKGEDATLSVNGKEVAEGIGPQQTRFTGKIEKVTIELKL